MGDSDYHSNAFNWRCNMTIEYRLARLQFLQDLIEHIVDQEPQLIDLTDWNSNTDAFTQMANIIKGEV
jgi:hypothetical protein